MLSTAECVPVLLHGDGTPHEHPCDCEGGGADLTTGILQTLCVCLSHKSAPPPLKHLRGNLGWRSLGPSGVMDLVLCDLELNDWHWSYTIDIESKLQYHGNFLCQLHTILQRVYPRKFKVTLLFTSLFFFCGVYGLFDSKAEANDTADQLGEICVYEITLFTINCLSHTVLFSLSKRLNYFKDASNPLDWCAAVFSLLFITPLFFNSSGTLHWEAGACAIFLAWVNFLLYLQRSHIAKHISRHENKICRHSF